MSKPDKSLLAELRSKSRVDCDTLDYTVAKDLGPFVDCTSNQAIAYSEALKPQNEQLIKDSVKLAEELYSKYEVISKTELATEILMVKLSLRIVPNLTGYVHSQTNTNFSHSTTKTVANAKRIVSLYHTIDPNFDCSRVCIKIPSTWEGLQACRILEQQGISTLATTLFSMEQAAVAANARCTYIAPYVNELKVHYLPNFVDTDKGFDLCRLAQQYYSTLSSCRTQVLPASLISVAEVMKLAGVHHITVSPQLLAELATTSREETSLDEPLDFSTEGLKDQSGDYQAILNDESAYRIAFTRSKNGANERKLSEAINIFCDMQDKLEALIMKYE